MNMFKVYRTQEFERLVNKLLTKEERARIDKIEDEIAEKGYTGKPLSFEFLREKKISDKRAYFIVYGEFQAVLMVSLSDKKSQQETIDKIKEYLPEFKRLMSELAKAT